MKMRLTHTEMYPLLHEVTHLEVNIISYICVFEQGWGWWVMVFNATFNNISAMVSLRVIMDTFLCVLTSSSLLVNAVGSFDHFSVK
jgi:hypothetical protein